MAKNYFQGMGQAKDEIIIPDPELFYSSPLLSLSIQRKIYAVDITLFIYFSLNSQGQQGAGLTISTLACPLYKKGTK